MYTLKQVLFLAVAGTAIAAPAAHRSRDEWSGPAVGRLPTNQGYEGSNEKITIVTYGGPTQGTEDKPHIVYVPYTGGQDQDQGSDSSADTPSTAPATPSPVAPSSDTGYMATVNKYRIAGALPALIQSSKLEANALKTANDGNGQMKHELNPGTMGQVLAPGAASDFEKVYVGGWLCEMPGLKGLNGICGKMTAGWDHSNGETGHAKILSNANYKNIGCALSKGIWACDLS